MVTALSRALEETDAELYECVFDGLLRIIVAFVPFGKFDSTQNPLNEEDSGVVPRSDVQQRNAELLQTHQRRENRKEDGRFQLDGHRGNLAELRLR